MLKSVKIHATSKINTQYYLIETAIEAHERRGKQCNFSKFYWLTKMKYLCIRVWIQSFILKIRFIFYLTPYIPYKQTTSKNEILARIILLRIKLELLPSTELNSRQNFFLRGIDYRKLPFVKFIQKLNLILKNKIWLIYQI